LWFIKTSRRFSDCHNALPHQESPRNSVAPVSVLGSAHRPCLAAPFVIEEGPQPVGRPWERGLGSGAERFRPPTLLKLLVWGRARDRHGVVCSLCSQEEKRWRTDSRDAPPEETSGRWGRAARSFKASQPLQCSSVTQLLSVQNCSGQKKKCRLFAPAKN
jgi:hypothetical protein